MRTIHSLPSKKSLHLAGGILLAMFLVLVPQIVRAQTATGTSTGTVTDPTGLVTASATVVVHNADTGNDSSYTTKMPASTLLLTNSPVITR